MTTKVLTTQSADGLDLRDDAGPSMHVQPMDPSLIPGLFVGADDLVTSTTLHQWVSGISGANGTGATCTVKPALALVQTQSGTAAMVLTRMVPSVAGGGSAGVGFAQLLGTETSLGANNPAWGIGFNAEATAGQERAIFQIERNFKNSNDGSIPNDTEAHIEFFDTANTLVSRSFSSTYYFYPTPQVVTSLNFQDGINSLAAPVPGYVTVNANGVESFRFLKNALSLEGTVDIIEWQFGRSPLITQQDEPVTAVPHNMTLRAGRSLAGTRKAASWDFEVRASNDATGQGVWNFKRETAVDSGVYAQLMSILNDISTGSAVLDGQQPIMSSNGIQIGQWVQLGGGAGGIFLQMFNSSAEPGASGAGGPPRLYGFAGALKAVGSGGTRVTLCAAEPHCPNCGADFMTEHENPKYGYLAVCLKCMADHLGEQPWIVRRPAVAQ